LRRTLGEDLTTYRDSFALFDVMFIDVQVTPAAPEYWQAGAIYWRQRSGDILTDWELFQTVATVELLQDMDTLFSETRQSPLSAPPDLQAGVTKDRSDPEV